MAKLGTYTHLWTERGTGGRIRTQYALRTDGVLLKKLTWLNPDGSLDFTTGWKIATRRPRPIEVLMQVFTVRGFSLKLG